MTTPPSEPSLPKSSPGYSLFYRQAQLHADDSGTPSNHSHATIRDTPLPSVTHQHHLYSPSVIHRRFPLISAESSKHSNNDNVQLLSVHPRPELTYIKEILPTTVPSRPPEKLLETDFPLIENPATEETEQTTSEHSIPSNTTCDAVIEKAFDYLTAHDDDDDVIHRGNDNEEQYHHDSFDDDDNDSVEINDLVTTTVDEHHNNNNIANDVQTGSSPEMNDKQYEDNETIHEKLNDYQSNMTCSSRGTVSEDYDSDFENSSHEDDEQMIHKDSIVDQEEEQQTQILLRQQQILRGIVQEWLRKEESYCEQLKMMEQQLSHNSIPNNVQKLIHQLSNHHKMVYLAIEDLCDRDHQPATLTKQLTKAIDKLMQTLALYNDYIQMNLAPIRKSLEKRNNTKELSSEDLLSIPPKQFLQILSQVQDLYQTAQSFESGDQDSIQKLYDYAQECKIVRNRQDENINKIILKTEDVAMMTTRGNRDRCRLILYCDAIVCCNWKTKLLASPKYTLLWFIPMVDLQWTVPQGSSDDNIDTGDELKTNLKSAYKELEKAPKTNHVISSRLSKNIRKQENEYNLAQSKLQLILSNASRSPSSSIILFSSNYQRQDWIDIIDTTKQDHLQRSSSMINLVNHPRLNDSLIQKRLDIVKPYSHESISTDLPSTLRLSPQNTQTKSPAKTYSGTLQIMIHSIHGSALCYPIRQHQTLPLMSSAQQCMPKNYQFFVAVEVDSYNTFYPCVQTTKQTMQQQESVEFKKEAFEVELEYSLAFRLLIHRIDTSTSGNNNSLQRTVCIDRFHRDIETTLQECKASPNGTLYFESRSGDLKLGLSMKYSKREGTFKRHASKRSQAVFGRSIEQLTRTPSGLIDGIPRIVVKCIEMVDRDGLEETGIYRVCCVTSDLQNLRRQFDRQCHLGEELLAEKNVHVAANLLKLFFRELPEPLFTTLLYKQFLQAIQLIDIHNQRVTLLNTVELLPPSYRKILFYLFDHLIRVSQNSQKNMMHLDNLAVVFGPTLMRPSKLIATTYHSGSNQRLNAIPISNGQTMQTDLDQMSSELQGSMFQCQVVLACLKLRRDGILK